MLHLLLLIAVSHALGWAQMAAGVATGLVAMIPLHAPAPAPSSLDPALLAALVARGPTDVVLPYEATALTPPDWIAPEPEELELTMEAILGYIEDAADLTGVSADYLEIIAYRESRFDPHAASDASSARGLYQFIESTWLDVFGRYAGEHGHGELAALIAASADGRPTVADPDKRAEILALRFDPRLASVLAARLASENRVSLETALGRPVSDAELYMAHFLGVFGATVLIREKDESPETSAAGLLPTAARANERFFYDPDGRELAVAAVYRTLAALQGGETFAALAPAGGFAG